MNKEKIFEKCIEGAVERGWDKKLIWKKLKIIISPHNHIVYTLLGTRVEAHINEVLFDAPFLKAFFGEEMVCALCGSENLSGDMDYNEQPYTICDNCHTDSPPLIPMWRYKGDELLYSEDRLKYMKQFVSEK